MKLSRTLNLASPLSWPMAMGAEAYLGLIIPIKQDGVEFKVENTAANTDGPSDARIMRLDGKSMANKRRKSRELAASICEGEGYRFDTPVLWAVTSTCDAVLTAGCKK